MTCDHAAVRYKVRNTYGILLCDYHCERCLVVLRRCIDCTVPIESGVSKIDVCETCRVARLSLFREQQDRKACDARK